MNYRNFPNDTENLSALGFGCMRLPERRGTIDYPAASHLLRLAIDEGVNYLDTAWLYHGGKSEEFLGRFLEEERLRDQVFIADKLPSWLIKKHEDIDRFFGTQLKRLRTNWIDYYLLHSLTSYSEWEKLQKAGIEDFLRKEKDQGRIRHIGFSWHGPVEEFKQVVDAYPWDFCQIQYNLLDEKVQAGTEGLQYASDKGLGIVVMEPLRGGHLAGRTPKDVERVFRRKHPEWSTAEWAFRWVWNHPEVSVVLSGMNREEHLRENLAVAKDALSGQLEVEDLEQTRLAAETWRRLTRVPCTGCAYCMPCPAGVDIPGSFENYNAVKLFRDPLVPRAMYLLHHGAVNEERESRLASQCIDCGACEKHCPQHIPIRSELKKVARSFEGFGTGMLKAILKRRFAAGDVQEA